MTSTARRRKPKPRPLWEAWFLRVGLPIYGGRRTGAVSTPSMLRVDYDRWGQTPEDLRQLATSAAHQRTRERFLALYEVTQASCATQVAARTRRHPQTVMGWLHLYNTRGPEALAYRRTGGRPPLCPEIEAGLGEVVRAAQHAAAPPP